MYVHDYVIILAFLYILGRGEEGEGGSGWIEGGRDRERESREYILHSSVFGCCLCIPGCVCKAVLYTQQRTVPQCLSLSPTYPPQDPVRSSDV